MNLLESIGWTALFAVSGLVLMIVGLWVFDLLLPLRLLQEAHEGNEAVGWLIAGFLISTGIVLADAFRYNAGLLQGLIYAALGIVLNYLCFFLWEWVTPRWSLNDALKNGSNTAGKILFGLFIAIGLVVSGSFS